MQTIFNKLLISSILLGTLTYAKVNIDLAKEVKYCIQILEYTEENSFRKSLNLKGLSKDEMKKNVITCAKYLATIKKENRMKACNEKFGLNETYKVTHYIKEHKISTKEFEKTFERCVYENW